MILTQAAARRRARVLCLALAALAALAVAAPAAAQDGIDKARGMPASASSVERPRNGGACNAQGSCLPRLANDGRGDTRWSSEFQENQWWQVDLGRERSVDTVIIIWEPAYAARYRISTSLDGKTFTTAADAEVRLSPGQRGVLQATRRLLTRTVFPARSARYVRITSVERASRYGISLWEVGVFGPADPQAPAPAPPAPQGAPDPAFESSPPPPSPPAEPPAPPAPAAPAAPAPAEPKLLRLMTPAAVVRMAGTFSSSGARVRLLTVRAPKGARVSVTCKGLGCPKRIRSRARTLRRYTALQRSFRAGVVIEVRVTQRGTLGHFTRFRIRRGAAPQRLDRCMPYGAKSPTRCPAGE